MSDQDEMAPQTPQTNFHAYQVTIRLRERAASMLGAAMEEAAMLDVAIEGQALEVKGLRKSLETAMSQTNQANELLRQELIHTDKQLELIEYALQIIYAFIPTTQDHSMAWIEQYEELTGNEVDYDTLMLPLLAQSSNGESDLTTSPEE